MSVIPKDFQDYDDDDPEIEFRKNRMDYWQALKLARKEYMQSLNDLNGQFDAWDFEEWLEKTYGLKLSLLNGNITDKYEIIDEKLYIMFILKFT
jgi:hypothetical protein